MVLSLLALLAFFHLGIPSSIASEKTEVEQEIIVPRQKLIQVDSEDQVGRPVLEKEGQTLRQQIPAQNAESRSSISSVLLVLKYLFWFTTNEEANKAQKIINDYNPFHIDFGDLVFD